MSIHLKVSTVQLPELGWSLVCERSHTRYKPLELGFSDIWSIYVGIVLMNKETHKSYNQFLFHSFLSALHVSKESSGSSSGARHNILYYRVQSVQTCYQASL